MAEKLFFPEHLKCTTKISRMNSSIPENCTYEWATLVEERFWLVAVAGTIVSTISFVENVFLFVMFVKSPQHRRSPSLYLLLLAFLDILLAFSYVFLMSLSVLIDVYGSMFLLRAWFAYNIPLNTFSHIAMTASSYLIVAASVERYCITALPNRVKCFQYYRPIIATATILFGVTIMASFPFEFEIRYVEMCAGLLTEYEIDLSELVKGNAAYNYWWRLIFRNIFSVLLPFVILSFMNIRIVVAVQRLKKMDRASRRLSDAQQKIRVRDATRTTLMVIFTYLLSKLLNVFITIWEYIDKNSLTEDYLAFYMISTDVVSISTIIAGAFRLPIYVICQPDLRKEFASPFYNLFYFTKKFKVLRLYRP
uniref:G_PROTEIN_RECEP_F1_2 domain-containing protein n=1 Tax=Syphacia muris TaxID=451379 RepID=A0A0N5AJE1_9BILA